MYVHSGIARKKNTKFKHTHIRAESGWKAFQNKLQQCNAYEWTWTLHRFDWTGANKRRESQTNEQTTVNGSDVNRSGVENSRKSKIRHYFARYVPFNTLFMYTSHANPHISWTRRMKIIKCLVTWNCKQFVAIFSSSTWYRKFFECKAMWCDAMRSDVKLSHCEMTIASNVNHSMCTTQNSAHVTFNCTNRYTIAVMLLPTSFTFKKPSNTSRSTLYNGRVKRERWS